MYSKFSFDMPLNLYLYSYRRFKRLIAPLTMLDLIMAETNAKIVRFLSFVMLSDTSFTML